MLWGERDIKASHVHAKRGKLKQKQSKRMCYSCPTKGEQCRTAAISCYSVRKPLRCKRVTSVWGRTVQPTAFATSLRARVLVTRLACTHGSLTQAAKCQIGYLPQCTTGLVLYIGDRSRETRRNGAKRKELDPRALVSSRTKACMPCAHSFTQSPNHAHPVLKIVQSHTSVYNGASAVVMDVVKPEEMAPNAKRLKPCARVRVLGGA